MFLSLSLVSPSDVYPLKRSWRIQQPILRLSCFCYVQGLVFLFLHETAVEKVLAIILREFKYFGCQDESLGGIFKALSRFSMTAVTEMLLGYIIIVVWRKSISLLIVGWICFGVFESKKEKLKIYCGNVTLIRKTFGFWVKTDIKDLKLYEICSFLSEWNEWLNRLLFRSSAVLKENLIKTWWGQMNPKE